MRPSRYTPEEDRREQVLDATLRVFAQKGFSFYEPAFHTGDFRPLREYHEARNVFLQLLKSLSVNTII